MSISIQNVKGAIGERGGVWLILRTRYSYGRDGPVTRAIGHITLGKEDDAQYMIFTTRRHRHTDEWCTDLVACFDGPEDGKVIGPGSPQMRIEEVRVLLDDGWKGRYFSATDTWADAIETGTDLYPDHHGQLIDDMRKQSRKEGAA